MGRVSMERGGVSAAVLGISQGLQDLRKCF